MQAGVALKRAPQLPGDAGVLGTAVVEVGRHGLARTTGWIHRALLIARGVQMVPGVTYRGIDAEGLAITSAGGEARVIRADHVVICAGQEPVTDLLAGLQASGRPVHVIGSARQVLEFGAEQAVREGVELGLRV